MKRDDFTFSSRYAEAITQGALHVDDALATKAERIAKELSYGNHHAELRVRAQIDELLISSSRRIADRCPGTKFQFSGSLWKGTFVLGLSDIDVLCLNKNWLAGTPSMAACCIVAALNDYGATRHAMHASLQMGNGPKVEFVPAAGKRVALLIGNRDGREWVRIDLSAFEKRLDHADYRLEGAVKVGIRWAKAATAALQRRGLLTGHHIEMMGLCVAEQLRTTVTPSAFFRMLMHRGPTLVLNPLPDPSAQFRFVDEYLGPDHSELRLSCSEQFREIAARF